MEDKGKATIIAEAIYDYLLEEGGDKITLAEAVGILELVKISVIEDMK